MEATRTLWVLLVTFALAGTTRAFFLPWRSSPSFSKPDLFAGLQEQMGPFPLAVPVPVPVAAAPPPLQVSVKAPPALPPQQMALPNLAQLPLAQLAGVPPGGFSAASLYSSMQLVPCLCSVPKEELDDAAANNGISVNAAQPQQQISN